MVVLCIHLSSKVLVPYDKSPCRSLKRTVGYQNLLHIYPSKLIELCIMFIAMYIHTLHVTACSCTGDTEGSLV